ncbi:MAG: PASTA domain-containing protein [Bacilli bacterium]|nr:PASTA domain-containing protein [Bacilli bacterium]
MKKSRKRRIRYDRVVILLFIIITIIFLVSLIFNKNKEIYMIDIVNKNIDDVYELLSDYDIEINISYEYNDNVDKGKVISQSILENMVINDGDKLDLVISLGKLDKEKLKNDGINELGKVPIMMYHGIKDMKDSETDYIGGNVDKDGYTRTSESFRRDLELYYQKGYRMIKLSDYINGNINTPYGKSPIVLTFDDGNANNIRVTGLDSDGNIIIDKNSAVGILEEYKKKYPDYNVTAIFFINNGLFNQPEYNDKIIKWLVDNGYEVGNHTKGHNDFTKIDSNKTQEVVGYMYNKLESIVGDKYSKIVALPYGSPYNKTHNNYKYIINGSYEGNDYETVAALRVGWEPEISPFNKDFDKTFLKRCRAYDNNGVDFDIEMTLRILDKNRYISDGNVETIVTDIKNSDIINSNIDKEIIMY